MPQPIVGSATSNDIIEFVIRNSADNDLFRPQRVGFAFWLGCTSQSRKHWRGAVLFFRSVATWARSGACSHAQFRIRPGMFTRSFVCSKVKVGSPPRFRSDQWVPFLCLKMV